MHEYVKMFVRNAIFPISLYDKEMRLLACSDAWKQMYQLTDLHVGHSHYQIFPDQPLHWIDAHHAALSGQSNRHIEEPYRLANGATGWHRWQCSPWTGAGNEIMGILITAENITTRKQRDIELNKVLARFELIQQAAKIGMWDWDIIGGQIIFNAEYYDVLGWDKRQNLSNEQFYNLIHPDDLYRVKDSMNSALNNGSDYEAEFRIYRKNDGKLRWVKDKGKIEFNSSKKPARGYGAIFDITEQKLLNNEQIRHATIEYDNFINHMLEGVWSIDKNGVTVFVNQALINLLGYSEEEIVGRSVINFVPIELREDTLKRMAERSEGKSDRDVYPLIKKDGEIIWCLFGANPIFEGDDYIGSVAILMDYTKRMQESMAKDKRIEELERLLTISHKI